VTDVERTPERWFEISLAVRTRDLDAATGLLAAAGHLGCEIVERGELGEIRVHVRADSLGDAQALATALASELPQVRATGSAPGVTEIDERIWREDWKKHFRCTRIGRRLEIVPPWEAQEPSQELRIDERIRIVINPGLAFGTGQHETTAGCLALLETHVREGSSVLDVGCGSGILAIAAAKLGAARILAVDNDPEAVNCARENCVLNTMAALVEVRLEDGPPAGEAFDVVVANILAETLAQMAAPLTSCVKPAGALVLSGIESERRRLVEVVFNAEGWRVAHEIERSGWTTLAFARRRVEGT
jgi:ribosomal protein L11 methyltransferase